MKVKLEQLRSVPSEWEVFARNSATIQAVKESIRESGVKQRIILWGQEDEAGEKYYIVLDGQNRVQACKELLEETGDEKYSGIHAFIFEADELTAKGARKVFVYTKQVFA